MSYHLPKTAKPLYKVMADVIEEKIFNGELSTNEQLPSEASLVDKYNVGRNTVRHAIHDLVKKGVLTTVHGVGTFVADPIHTKTAEFLYGFTQELALEGYSVTSKEMEANLITADEKLSEVLNLDIGEEIVYLHRLRLMDGDPTAIEKAYLPHKLFPNLLKHDFEKNSLYHILSAEYNQTPDSAEQEIHAALANENVGKLLKLKPPAVVINFTRQTKNTEGKIIEYVESSLPSDKFRFYTNLKLNNKSARFSLQHLSSRSKTENI